MDIASGTHQVKPTLVVTILEDSQFENWKYIALIAALHIQVENTTNAQILVGGYAYTGGADQQQKWEGQESGEEIMYIRREINRREETQHYGQPLRNFARIGAG